MGWVRDTTGIDLTIDELSDPVNEILSPVEDTIKDIGSEIDDFVNEEIPGGWGTVAALAGAAYYGLPSFGEAGLTTTEAGFLSADVAQLASQGLSEAQIAQILGQAGVDPLIAADAAQLAAQGLSASQIEGILAQQTLAPATGATSSISIQDALRGANLANQLLGTQPQYPQMGGQMGGQASGQATGVDYNSLLNLLASKASGTGLLGTQFSPQVPNLANVIAEQKLSSLLG